MLLLEQDQGGPAGQQQKVRVSVMMTGEMSQQ